VTIDTLRADRVGAYGYTQARTPNMDGLARGGARFEHAFATAPITLPSHASMMSGLYPSGHGSRHNGMPVDQSVPTLAKALSAAGFSTAAFVGAFPLDRRFKLDAGFATYGDRMPRGSDGRLASERPGHVVVSDAIKWLETPAQRRFLWVHLFEPHAPYGDARSGKPTADRYDDEIAEADGQIGRLLKALGSELSHTLVIVVADHGEAFGEHGEISHSIFVYDTTLRVPLIMNGPGVAARPIGSPVSVVDIAPTALALLGVNHFDADGIDLTPALGGAELPDRELYAESFAPMIDFGWSPLQSLRVKGFKYIAAPRAELYDVQRDPGETRDLSATDARRAAELRERVQRYAAASRGATAMDPEAVRRLQALGYASGGGRSAQGSRPDPKDRRALAAKLARISSDELHGADLERALRQVLKESPDNAFASVRLGHVLANSGRCSEAIGAFKSAMSAGFPGTDAHLGLALCQVRAGRIADAESTLADAERIEPESPVVLANHGIALSDAGRHQEGATRLERAVALDPDFHQARFNLARVLARAGRRGDAAREATELLSRLPADAPQRAEVQRLLDAVR
jgi:arylsulfatase A-like enzyme